MEPLPTGAWAFLAVTTAVFTKVLTFPQAFGAFTNDVIWLIVVSFFFAAVSFSAAGGSAYCRCNGYKADGFIRRTAKS